MPLTFTDLTNLYAHGHDTVIDVRSPAEFAEDHIPGAINLPALTNAERARVGTIYKQVSPFDARKIGAALVARNVANHLTGPLADKPGGWQPLVYCWRGGQRSGSVAAILTQIGWRAETIRGGYQAYRRLVHAQLYAAELPHRIVLLDGYTGTAKTALLRRLAGLGVQVIDLEGAARHRGSLLGGYPSGQPSQKAFESVLAADLQRCDPTQVTVLEAESAKIGRLNIPQSLWHKMRVAPRLVVTAPLPARAAHLRAEYSEFASETDFLRAKLMPLREIRGHAVVDHWCELLDAGDQLGLATALMQDHYDPAYDRSRKIDTRDVCGTVSLTQLDGAALDAGAARIAGIIRSL